MIIERHAKDLQVGDLVIVPFKAPYAVTHITHGRFNVYVRFAECGKVTYKAHAHVPVEIPDPEDSYHNTKCPVCKGDATFGDKENTLYCHDEACSFMGQPPFDHLDSWELES